MISHDGARDEIEAKIYVAVLRSLLLLVYGI